MRLNQETDAWFHFLCKNIVICPKEDGRGQQRLQIVNRNIRPEDQGKDGKPKNQHSQADHSWIRSAFLMKHEPLGNTATRFGNSRSSSSSSRTFVHPNRCVTLICFEPPPNLESRFDQMATQAVLDQVLEDPYALFDIVLDELYLQMDGIAWDLSKVFGEIEWVS